MVVEADLSVMMICTQKNRAAKPYMHLPHQSLKELAAQKRAGLLWLSPCEPTEKVSVLVVAVHFLLSPVYSSPRQYYLN